jgi:hypothetical protein
MKREKQPLAEDRRKTLTLIWIANSTEFFITCLKDHTPADIDAGIEHAVDCFLNKNETPGSAIPMGVFLARQRIKQRRAVVVDFWAKRRQAHRRAYVGV